MALVPGTRSADIELDRAFLVRNEGSHAPMAPLRRVSDCMNSPRG